MLATTLGEKLGGLNFKHPLHDASADAGTGQYSYRRLSPVFLADYATADDGTGIVHSSPAYGVDDFNSCVANGFHHDDILNPVQATGVYVDELPLFGGQFIWKAAPVIVDALRDAGRLLATETITHSYPHCASHKTPVICAPQPSGSSGWTKVKACSRWTRHPKPCASLALNAIEETSFYPENGKVRLRDMIARAARLVYLAPAAGACRCLLHPHRHG